MSQCGKNNRLALQQADFVPFGRCCKKPIEVRGTTCMCNAAPTSPHSSLNVHVSYVTVTCGMTQCFRSVFCEYYCGFPSEKRAKVRTNSISSSLPQGSHEIARRMRITSAFRAQISFSTVVIYTRKIFYFYLQVC